METPKITGYSFTPTDMNIAGRTMGISAFMRCRNGADFVEATIRSHIEFYDEIVVVYNQCTDSTPDILARLQQEFFPKLRVFHYTDRVQPLGSDAHAKAAADSPQSMVNYSNFALSRTQHCFVVKLDDDHLAIGSNVKQLCKDLCAGRADPRFQHCFSGFNIARGADGNLGIPAFDPIVGGGDHGYFLASEDTRFYYDRRFERFGRGALQRRFAGFYYWHLKYLKSGQGFVNYELGDNPNSRYARKKAEFERSRLYTLSEALAALKPGTVARLVGRISEKHRLKYERDVAVDEMFTDSSIEASLDRLCPGWRNVPRLGSQRDTHAK